MDAQTEDLLAALAERGIYSRGDLELALGRIDQHRLARVMQRIQDETFLDENNHRYHCGGSEAALLARRYEEDRGE